MFLPIKVILDRRPRRDGLSPISIQYCFASDKRTVLPTGLSIPARYWNKKFHRITSELPARIGQTDLLNLQLQKMVRSAEDLVIFALEQKMEDPVGFLKKAWRPDLDAISLASHAKKIAELPAEPAVNLDFFFQMDEYIKAKRRKVSAGMIRTYNVVKERLLAFQKYRRRPITFDSFDFNFYEDLVNYLTYEHAHRRRKIVLRGLKRNSVGTTIKQIRIFLRDRTRRKIIPAIDLTDFKILDEEADAIYLTVAEIRACTGSTYPPIPGGAGSAICSSWGALRDCGSPTTAASSPRIFGKACSTKSKANPTTGWSYRYGQKPMTSLSTAPELIMKISGHKSLKDFYKYIRITPEEAGKKIQQIWENRGEMRPVG